MTDIIQSILAINPDAQVSVNAEDVNQITWLNNTPVISNEDILAKAGQGAFEIRTSIAVAGAAGGKGKIYFYKPIPEFACGCLVASMKINKNDM